MSITEKAKENKLDIKKIEKTIYIAALAAGQAAMCEYLEKLDNALGESRDRKAYRDKGKRRTVLKTMLGEVEYSRRVYETADKDGRKSYVYLLDQALGIDTPGQISPMLSELVATAACESTYRETARHVSEMTGQKITHTTAWTVTQTIGAKLRAEENNLAEKAKQNKGTGQIESKLLNEEQDGIWLTLQGMDRKEYGESKEMKIAIAYDGIIVAAGGRRQLSNKVACASFDRAEEFIARKEGVIASVYNVDEIDKRVLNGDGANWISAQKREDTLYQLDPFHRNKAIRENVNDPELRELMAELLFNQKIDDLLNVIDASIHSTDDSVEQKKRESLLQYFQNNKEALVPYRDRGEDIPAVNAGLSPAPCGAMESNVFTLIGNRMKGGRACWSVPGANHMAVLLCLKHTGRLTKALAALGETISWSPSPTITGFSAGKTQHTVGEGYNGYKHAAIPDIPWIKGILGMKALSALRFS